MLHPLKLPKKALKTNNINTIGEIMSFVAITYENNPKVDT